MGMPEFDRKCLLEMMKEREMMKEWERQTSLIYDYLPGYHVRPYTDKVGCQRYTPTSSFPIKLDFRLSKTQKRNLRRRKKRLQTTLAKPVLFN